MSKSRPMRTRGSVTHYDSACCETVPPLSPLAYLIVLFLPYLSMVIGNAVTLRQIAYADAFEKQYGEKLSPLPDTSILSNVELPSFTNRLAMRDWVNVLAALWCSFMFLLWLVKRNYVALTTFLAAETFLVPMFALSQWLTIVPDSDPKCLSTINIPDGEDWIWYRMSLIQCGDMMWSSAIVQVIIFSMLGFSGYKSKCFQVSGFVLSVIMVITISCVAWLALYQYSCDIVLSIFVTSFVVTHPFVRYYGLVMFYTEWDIPSRYVEEKVGLMSDEYEEEFSIEGHEEDL